MMEMEVKNAKITSTMFGVEDHGILSFMLFLDYGGSGQGAGGYALDKWSEERQDRIGVAAGLNLLVRIMKVVGVDKWEDLPGKYIRVRADHCHVVAIGNMLKEDWVDFAQFFKDNPEV